MASTSAKTGLSIHPWRNIMLRKFKREITNVSLIQTFKFQKHSTGLLFQSSFRELQLKYPSEMATETFNCTF